nr:DUF1589 domain-containing protein [Rhodopirellula europaea]
MNSGESSYQDINVGQVITWHQADALEQSESSSHSRKTQRQPSNHPARHSLAYGLPRHNPPRKQGHSIQPPADVNCKITCSSSGQDTNRSASK